MEPALQETIVRSAKVAALLGFHLFSILERLEVKYVHFASQMQFKIKKPKVKKIFIFIVYHFNVTQQF